jgi:hypothetical protein
MAAEEDIGPSVEDLILDLASTRTDGIPVRTRNAFLSAATKSLAAAASDRTSFAEMGGTFLRRMYLRFDTGKYHKPMWRTRLQFSHTPLSCWKPNQYSAPVHIIIITIQTLLALRNMHIVE